MKHTFYKYQGTGNDFIIIDNRLQLFDKNNTKLIENLCDRRFGIGADGLILLEDHNKVDFKMIYYNSDGNESTMCGNGGRCIVAFAKYLGIVEHQTTFEAIDGLHEALIEKNLVHLKMQDVENIEPFNNDAILNTGSPHFVSIRSKVNEIDVFKEGAIIRYSEPFSKSGINVNFVERLNTNGFLVRTYERGVEDETLSCGTGVTAVALAMHYLGETKQNHLHLKTKGGELQIKFNSENGRYTNIWLIGPVGFVFKGEIEW